MTLPKLTPLVLAGLYLGWTACLPTALRAQEVRMSGAAAMSAALSKKQPQIEAAAGVKLQITSKNAGKGLQDLAAGAADIALVTGSVEKAAEGANAEKSGSVNAADLVKHAVGSEPVVFVVHPSNPVTTLTLAQLKDILTGKTANWKDVGGPDATIEIFTLGPRNGPRIALDEQLLKGAEVAKTAVLREAPPHICPIVAQKTQALGFVGESNLGPGVKTLKTDAAVTMGHFLVTRGTPGADQKKVIEAVTKSYGGQ